MSLQSVRGTHDLLPEDFARQLRVIEAARKISKRFGFKEIATPIFEFTEVFTRTIGEASDIVSKEMYSFQDRGGDSITLRPEGTAGVARAFISEGLSQNIPLKLFYQGPMFRYERPQKGRQRQFHQLGVELLGVQNHLADIECLALADMILSELGVRSKSTLEINSLGDQASRDQFLVKFKEFLNDYVTKLSEDSQRRLKLNPLRILDSKDAGDQKILTEAPSYNEFLTSEAQDFFSKVCEGLKQLKIDFKINPRLVRGLDYYNHVVFEYRTTELGAQDAVLSGGRYDQLIKTMGGPATPGVGWGAGIERLVLLDQTPLAATRPVVIVPLGDAAENLSVKLAYDLRGAGFNVELTFSGNMSKRMKKAAQFNARHTIIIGDDEVKTNSATVKDMDNGQQKNVPLSEIKTVLV